MHFFALLLLLGSVACSKSLKQFYDQDGILTYEVNCSGRNRTVADCYSTASNACRGKYKILSLSQNDDVTSTAVVNGGFGAASTQNNYGRSMMFRCEVPPPGSRPTERPVEAPKTVIHPENVEMSCEQAVAAREYRTVKECKCVYESDSKAAAMRCRP